ncbi:zinc finger protein 37-like isoform X2 [Mercenaria mercenaria]|uniref:zinc finger protein 37-like isoform X2 n=1 Tax=Mercenaria mercenaria TaxID=6596 RepID=UPI00234E69E4|nr:zinc finger protein 37-like isoform X2 [Mercenaria mercenaria]
MEDSPPKEAKVHEKQRKPKWAKRQHLIRISDAVWKRWNDVKAKNECKSHDDFARMLLDSWEKSKIKEEGSGNVDDMASTSAKHHTDLNNDDDGQSQHCDGGKGEDTGSSRDMISEKKAICLNTELLKLANLRIKKICTQKFCNKIVTVTARYIGTSAQLNWTCSRNHQIYTWNSQPNVNATPAVDLLLCSVMPPTEYSAVHVTLRNVGIEIMSPPPSIGVDVAGLMSRRTENPVSVSFGQSIGRSNQYQQYPDFERLRVKGELGSEDAVYLDSNVEESTTDDMMFSNTEIKIEVNEEESQMDLETDSATDEEYNYIDFFSSTNKVLKLQESGDKGIEDCGIKSARIKKKGYRPNYAALEWKEDSDVENEGSGGITHDRNEDQSMVEDEEETERKSDATDDPDFNIAGEAGDEDSEVDSSEDDTIDNDAAENDVEISDDTISKENKHRLAATSKQTNECPSEGELEPKRKRLRRPNRKKQEKAEVKQNKTKKPWIKIHLADHDDKYKIETVESFERKNRKIDASENLYSCLVCQHFKCSSKDAIEDHLEKHVNKALECENCQYISYCCTDIREHRRKCSQTVKAVFVCDICGYCVSSSDSKKNHMGKVHDVAEWKCRYCPDLFRTRNERLDHMRHEHPESCQYCDSCRQSKFKMSKEEFQTHIQNCSSKVQCQICGTFVVLNGMNKHIHDKHENVRKYQCHKCPYSAKSSKRLKTHLLSHENIHPHGCDQCSFTCIQPYQLKSHMRTHTGEKPYKCTQCKYAAAWNVQLKEHVKVHSMETAVMCNKCDIIFKNEKTLHIHIKKEQCLL